MNNKARFARQFILPLLTIVLLLFYNNCGKSFEGQNGELGSSSLASAANDVGANFSGQIDSNFMYVSTSGAAWGYASDLKNPTKTIKVIFYIDGPVGTGQYLGETQANLDSLGPRSGHYFLFNVPTAFINGKQHVIYAYAHNAIAANLLKPNAITYVAYAPKAEAIFNQQIRSFVQSNCASCHTWDYAGLYSGPLLAPTPFAGATATTNRFIQKMSGQTGHSGGVFCAGGVNSGICTEIQRWWNAEFL
ncbi:MAG: hypothetical protein AABY64_14685 [Bdellovibrionota bacterium]